MTAIQKKIFDHDKQRKQLIKKFHVLLGQRGLGTDGKEAILAGYGVAHTNELTLQQLQDICFVLQRNRRPTEHDEMDKWRKRAIAAAFGQAKALGYAITMAGAKAMVLRATGNEYATFNKIPQARLQAIYYGFKRNVKDMNATVEVAQEVLIEQNAKLRNNNY